MTQEKVIFIIPGFRQQVTSQAYKEIRKFLKYEGYHPVIVKIPWKNSTISENADYFLKKFNVVDSKKKYILGFSYGAMIAFIASTKVKTDGLILCSMSPYFREDVARLESPKSALMQERYEDFMSLHCGTLAKKIKSKKILMLYGAEEARSLIKRVTTTFSQLETSKKYLLPILETEHNIFSKKYLKTILEATRTLL